MDNHRTAAAAATFASTFGPAPYRRSSPTASSIQAPSIQAGAPLARAPRYGAIAILQVLSRRCLVLVVGSFGLAKAQTNHLVPASFPTIQAAIGAASSGDTVLVAPGTYVETIDFLGKAIAVRSAGGAAVTTIDGNQAGTVVRFVTGETPASVLEGFTITNGLGPTVAGTLRAAPGGVLCAAASPTIRRCVIAGNRGGDGSNSSTNAQDGGYGGPGGLLALGSELRLADCEFAGNVGGRGGNSAAGTVPGLGGDGGACVVLSFTATNKDLVRCRFHDNTGGDGGAGSGSSAGTGGRGGEGGLWLSLALGSVHLADCEFRRNRGGHGGSAGGSGALSAGSGGNGAFDFLSVPGWSASVTMSNCAVVGNLGGNAGAGQGGIAGNGGGTLGTGGQGVVVVSSTFAGNVAGTSVGAGAGVGGLAVVTNQASQVALRNCIVWGNLSGGLAADLRATGMAPVVTTSDLGTVTGTTVGAGNLSVNPLFANLATGDVHLTAASPCRHTGSVVAGLPLFDLDGDPRTVGPATDMGADEWDGLVGTREDFVFAVAVNGAFAPAVVGSPAAANDIVTLGIRSPGGAFTNDLAILGLEAWLPPNVPVGPAPLPAIHVGPSAFVLFAFPNGTGANGVALPVTVPAGLSGFGLRLQAFALTPNAHNGIFVATAARDLLL